MDLNSQAQQSTGSWNNVIKQYSVAFNIESSAYIIMAVFVFTSNVAYIWAIINSSL